MKKFFFSLFLSLLITEMLRFWQHKVPLWVAHASRSFSDKSALDAAWRESLNRSIIAEYQHFLSSGACDGAPPAQPLYWGSVLVPDVSQHRVKPTGTSGICGGWWERGVLSPGPSGEMELRMG